MNPFPVSPDIALCVGHSRRIGDRYDGGAVSIGWQNEREYNQQLAALIHTELKRHGISAEIIDDYSGNSYSSAMSWLAGYLKNRGVKLAVELHFNAATPTARGHEWLHWHSSPKGKLLATRLHMAMCDAFPDLPARGVKPRTSGERGSEFLRLTHCPAVICEPFFGSNTQDWKLASENMDLLARVHAASLTESFLKNK